MKGRIDIRAVGWVCSIEPWKSLENLWLGNSRICVTWDNYSLTWKKYIVRDSSALFDDKVHSLVFISAQEIYSKSCQTLPSACDLTHKVLFICEINPPLSCQCPRMKSPRIVNAFCPVRCIHWVPCSELYWGISEQTLKKPPGFVYSVRTWKKLWHLWFSQGGNS